MENSEIKSIIFHTNEMQYFLGIPLNGSITNDVEKRLINKGFHTSPRQANLWQVLALDGEFEGHIASVELYGANFILDGVISELHLEIPGIKTHEEALEIFNHFTSLFENDEKYIKYDYHPRKDYDPQLDNHVCISTRPDINSDDYLVSIDFTIYGNQWINQILTRIRDLYHKHPVPIVFDSLQKEVIKLSDIIEDKRHK